MISLPTSKLTEELARFSGRISVLRRSASGVVPTAGHVTPASVNGADAQIKFVLYWCQASVRSHANLALDYAICRANTLGIPCIAVFGLTDTFPGANERSFAFLFEGLLDAALGMARRGVRLIVLHRPSPVAALQLAQTAGCALVVVDKAYLRICREWRRQVAAELRVEVVEVEDNVIIPTSCISSPSGGEKAAATLRPKLLAHLDRFLRVFPSMSLACASAIQPAAAIAVPTAAADSSRGETATHAAGAGSDLCSCPAWRPHIYGHCTAPLARSSDRLVSAAGTSQFAGASAAAAAMLCDVLQTHVFGAADAEAAAAVATTRSGGLSATMSVPVPVSRINCASAVSLEARYVRLLGRVARDARFRESVLERLLACMPHLDRSVPRIRGLGAHGGLTAARTRLAQWIAGASGAVAVAGAGAAPPTASAAACSISGGAGASTAAHSSSRGPPHPVGSLAGYASQRKGPEEDKTSRLSPYLHFGHISPIEVAVAAMHGLAAAWPEADTSSRPSYLPTAGLPPSRSASSSSSAAATSASAPHDSSSPATIDGSAAAGAAPDAAAAAAVLADDGVNGGLMSDDDSDGDDAPDDGHHGLDHHRDHADGDSSSSDGIEIIEDAGFSSSRAPAGGELESSSLTSSASGEAVRPTVIPNESGGAHAASVAVRQSSGASLGSSHHGGGTLAKGISASAAASAGVITRHGGGASGSGKAPSQADKRSFLNELLVWRELAVNFVQHHMANYDDYSVISDISPWAAVTLQVHACDRVHGSATESSASSASAVGPSAAPSGSAALAGGAASAPEPMIPAAMSVPAAAGGAGAGAGASLTSAAAIKLAPSAASHAEAAARRAALVRQRGVYSFEQLECGGTGDVAWNAAQREMLLTGRMHGYMRMYWGKMLLTWAASPESAYAQCVYLNDKWQLDGRTANGYLGIAWVFGAFDRPFPARPVLGQVRPMTPQGLHKFNIRAYIARVDRLYRECDCPRAKALVATGMASATALPVGYGAGASLLSAGASATGGSGAPQRSLLSFFPAAPPAGTGSQSGSDAGSSGGTGGAGHKVQSTPASTSKAKPALKRGLDAWLSGAADSSRDRSSLGSETKRARANEEDT